MPSEDEIRERAQAIYRDEFYKATGRVPPTPEDRELKEGNYWLRAQQDLMSGLRSELEQYLSALREEMTRIEEYLGVEKPPPPPQRMLELEEEVARLKERIKRSMERRREAEKRAKELEEELKRKPVEKPTAPPTPPPARPPVAPPPRPPVRVLPPVPEACPIDGTPLEEVTRVPLLITNRERVLTAEEEYFRAEMKLPLPTMRAEWVNVPPTMKVWQCRENHIFERDAAGNLVERTPESLYRRIIREEARLRRLIYPPRAPPPEGIVIPREYAEYVPKTWVVNPILPDFYDWLQGIKNISKDQWLKMSKNEREIIMDEYGKWMLDQIEDAKRRGLFR